MCVCLLLEGFFSGSEIGVVSANQIRLRHRAAKGSRGAKLALEMLKKPEWLLSTTLVGTNIAVVTNTTVVTATMIQLLGEQGGWLAVGLVAPLIWIFGEIIPKSVFQERADDITPYAIFGLRFASYVFFPLLVIFSFITRFFTKLSKTQHQNPFTLREEILTMLQMPGEKGDIQSEEKDMIRRLFNFSEITAREIMVPLIDVVAIEKGADCGQAAKLAGESAHIRLPVYDERIDRLTGVLNTLDIFGADPEESIQRYVRPVRYVPMTKNISELMMELLKERHLVTIVVDEFGGAVGFITVEDIMEEVVEDIEDEYDRNAPSFQKVFRVSPKELVVNARIEIHNLEKELGIQLPKGKYATLAGFLLEKAGDIPPSGAVIRVKGIVFTIERSTPQAIQEVRVSW
jgi:CBS domain containing-hemolysin-like protein